MTLRDAVQGLLGYWDSLDAIPSNDPRPTELFRDEMDRRLMALRDLLDKPDWATTFAWEHAAAIALMEEELAGRETSGPEDKFWNGYWAAAHNIAHDIIDAGRFERRVVPKLQRAWSAMSAEEQKAFRLEVLGPEMEARIAGLERSSGPSIPGQARGGVGDPPTSGE